MNDGSSSPLFGTYPPNQVWQLPQQNEITRVQIKHIAYEGVVALAMFAEKKELFNT